MSAVDTAHRLAHREDRRGRHPRPDIFDLLFLQLAADAIPTYEAYFFETTDTAQYFGYNGEYTHIMAKTERDVKRFWDIFSDDIQLVAMHGSVLLNEVKTAATYELLFGLDHDTAALFASLVHNALLQSQTLNGGNHPTFTFNAFAVTTDDGSIPDKIIMGDGVLEGYKAIGFDDVAPQAVYAHEFGHHIQVERGYFEDPLATTGDPPEQTRYTELMARFHLGPRPAVSPWRERREAGALRPSPAPGRIR